MISSTTYLGNFDPSDPTAVATLQQVEAATNVDMSDGSNLCSFVVAVVSPAGTGGTVPILRATMRASDIIAYCADGMSALLSNWFRQGRIYDGSQGLSCSMATDMVLVAQMLGETGSDSAKIWSLGRREMALLLLMSSAFQSDVVASAALVLPGAAAVSVMLPTDEAAGTFIAPSIPPSCDGVPMQSLSDLPDAGSDGIVPASYEDAIITPGSTTSTTSSWAYSWVLWGLISAAAVTAGAIYYDHRKGE